MDGTHHILRNCLRFSLVSGGDYPSGSVGLHAMQPSSLCQSPLSVYDDGVAREETKDRVKSFAIKSSAPPAPPELLLTPGAQRRMLSAFVGDT